MMRVDAEVVSHSAAPLPESVPHEEPRCIDRPRAQEDHPGTNGKPVSGRTALLVQDARNDTGHTASFHHQPVDLAQTVDARTPAHRVRERGEVHRLLGVPRTPEPALTGPRAITDRSRDRLGSQLELLSPPTDDASVVADDVLRDWVNVEPCSNVVVRLTEHARCRLGRGGVDAVDLGARVRRIEEGDVGLARPVDVRSWLGRHF